MQNFKNLLYAYNLTKYDKGRLLPLSVTVHPTRFPYSSYMNICQVSPIMTKLIHNIAKSFLKDEKCTQLHLGFDTFINEIKNDKNTTKNKKKKTTTNKNNANESQSRDISANTNTTLNIINNFTKKDLLCNQTKESIFTLGDLKDPLVSLLSQITAIKPIKRTDVIFIRTDYMLQGTQPVQVEINTISCAFVFMGPKINHLHALYEDGVEVSRSDNEFCAMILAVWRCFVHDRNFIGNDDNRNYIDTDRINELIDLNKFYDNSNGTSRPETFDLYDECIGACNPTLNDTLRTEVINNLNVDCNDSWNVKNICKQNDDESNNKKLSSNNEALITNNERTLLHNNNYIMLMVDNCVTEDSGNYFEKIEIIKKMKEKGIDVIHVTFDELIKELKYKKKEIYNEVDYNKTTKGTKKGNEIKINNFCNEKTQNDNVKNINYIDNDINDYSKTNTYIDNTFNRNTNNVNTQKSFTYNKCNNKCNNLHSFYDFDEIKKYIESLLNTQKPCDIEYDLIYKDKTVFFIYYRWFYNLSHYTKKYTLFRAILECSSAISLPSAELQIAGSKSIQVKLKDKEYIKKFLSQEEILKVKNCFGEFKELKDLKKGDENLYILKSLNEGGGNNIFGEEIIKYKNSIENKLTDIKDTSNNNNKIDFDKGDNQEGDTSKISNKIINEGSNNKTSKRGGNEINSDYDNINKVNNDGGVFLMRKIESPTFLNRFLNDKNDRETIPEVGIMGWGLIRNGELVINKNAGYICRTKDKDSKECGVSCGFGALDSIYKN